jgi:hypothetical protein
MTCLPAPWPSAEKQRWLARCRQIATKNRVERSEVRLRRVTSGWPWVAAGVLLVITGTAGAQSANRTVGANLSEVRLPEDLEPRATDWLTGTGGLHDNWQLELPPAQQEQLIASSLLVVPRGNEMAVIAGIEFARSDRHARADVVRWFNARSRIAGVASNFLIHGADSGMHLDVRSRHSLMLRWDSRF